MTRWSGSFDSHGSNTQHGKSSARTTLLCKGQYLKISSMSINLDDLRALQTLEQKRQEANLANVGVTELPNGAPKPDGLTPLYHSRFGSYLLWVTTGLSDAEAPAQYFGPSWAQYGFEGVVQRLINLLKRDEDELAFNRYSYLSELLREEIQQQKLPGNSLLTDIQEWLQKQVEEAEAYASIFSPPRYNVQTLVSVGDRGLSREFSEQDLQKPLHLVEWKRLEYYRRLDKKLAFIQRKETALLQLLEAQKREATSTEQKLLANLEKQSHFFMLSGIADQMDKKRLRARHLHTLKTRHFERALRTRLLHPLADNIKSVFGSFQPKADSATGEIPRHVEFNLAMMIEEYDTCLKYRSTPASRRAYSKGVQATLAAKKALVAQHLNPYRELDSHKLSVLEGVVDELFEQFNLHIQKSLSDSVTQPVESPVQEANSIDSINKESLAPIVTSVTVDDLCCNGFTSEDWKALLVHLDVLTKTPVTGGFSYELSGPLVAKGKARISKTYAALVKLEGDGLIDLSRTDWEAALIAEPYGMAFGEKVKNYRYKASRSRNGSNSFDIGFDKTRQWLDKWEPSKPPL